MSEALIAIPQVGMAERSKALRSGRSPVFWAWVQIPFLTAVLANDNVKYGMLSIVPQA